MTGTSYTGKVSRESKHILGCLLQDFTTRNLKGGDLGAGYVGVPMADLKQRSLGADSTTTEVDFELALKELEGKELIATGPMAVHENPPGSMVIVLGVYSKREFVYLTEKGYKAAR